MRPPSLAASRPPVLLPANRTLLCWSRALAEPVRRARRTSSLCAWVEDPPRAPRLRNGPLLGGCLAEILGDASTGSTAPDGAPGSPLVRPLGAAPGERARPPARRRWAGEEHAARPPQASAPCPPGPLDRPGPPPPVPSLARRPGTVVRVADAALLRRCAGLAAPVSAVPARRFAPPDPAAPGTPAPGPVPTPAATHRPLPEPCPPEAPLALASARSARLLHAGSVQTGSVQTGSDEVGRAAAARPLPARSPVRGPVAPAEVLFRHAGQGWARHRPGSARPAPPVRQPGPGRRQRAGAPASVEAGGHGADPGAGLVEAGRGGAELLSGAARRAAAAESTDDVGAPDAPPTASDRLGPAPVLTDSEPTVVAPAAGADRTMPVASGTLRRAAGRDAAPPDFLDDAELSRRMARVLQDEARRSGIEV
jgi:hypothetical protein